MPQGDQIVWRLFLAQHGAEWPAYAYDVELTGGSGGAATPDPVMQQTWMRLTAKRIDAVGIRASGVTLFEVRHFAAWQSVGQLIGYRDLFPIDYPEQRIEAAIIVTDAIDQQIRAVAERQGLTIILVA